MRPEVEWRSAVEGEIAGEVTHISNDMQEILNK
jgi:hypothetical protein